MTINRLNQGTTNQVLVKAISGQTTNLLELQDSSGNVVSSIGPTGALGGTISQPQGLVHIETVSIGTGVASVTVSNCFSAAYDSYQVFINGGVASSANYVQFRLGLNGTPETASNYNSGMVLTSFSTGAVTGSGLQNQSRIFYAGRANTNFINLDCRIIDPFLTKHTRFHSQFTLDDTFAVHQTGSHKLATSYNDLVIIGESAITFTGGTVSVYGYTKG